MSVEEALYRYNDPIGSLLYQYHEASQHKDIDPQILTDLQTKIEQTNAWDHSMRIQGMV